MKIAEKEYKREELMQHVGNISQVAGIKAYTLRDGRAKGVDAFDVKVGNGFNFTVLADRAMDIAWMEYNGMPVGYITKAGISNPQYYQSNSNEGLRNFYAGVLTTCGMSNVGPSEVSDDKELGIHGRLANIPAFNSFYETSWDKDELVMTMKGKMQEAVLFGENLILSREITAKTGQTTVVIKDEIENQSFQDTPFMILYHINLGFPLVSETSKLIAPIIKAVARDAEAAKGIENYDSFQAPTQNYAEQVFFHNVAAGEDGSTCAGIINEALNLGVCIKYNKNELPFLTEWKSMGQQDYVVGVEPGNCVPIGRNATRANGDLVILKPGEKRNITVEISVLTTKEEIENFKATAQKLKEQGKK